LLRLRDEFCNADYINRLIPNQNFILHEPAQNYGEKILKSRNNHLPSVDPVVRSPQTQELFNFGPAEKGRTLYEFNDNFKSKKQMLGLWWSLQTELQCRAQIPTRLNENKYSNLLQSPSDHILAPKRMIFNSYLSHMDGDVIRYRLGEELLYTFSSTCQVTAHNACCTSLIVVGFRGDGCTIHGVAALMNDKGLLDFAFNSYQAHRDKDLQTVADNQSRKYDKRQNCSCGWLAKLSRPRINKKS
jgi:hypothetical protein